ncbi:MAG: hypothetical protein KatS3mg028_0271 [Bacteroidia bacterium]|nr:MAG: hypothetical protein KatS3mg028_0271 [Bacteroidia bacterium]
MKQVFVILVPLTPFEYKGEYCLPLATVEMFLFLQLKIFLFQGKFFIIFVLHI